MAAIHRSARAEIDLIEIWTFIARDDPAAADRQLTRIDTACRWLAENPHIGPRREDLAAGLRFYPTGNYLIFYTLLEGGIAIARVIHGARDYPRDFE
ncbi:MAG TPA: type II toxin-antitoxin system RelE/ParE family toxin [Chthoniobacter sp.]|jgi:toxin ParE1/3/4